MIIFLAGRTYSEVLDTQKTSLLKTFLYTFEKKSIGTAWKILRMSHGKQIIWDIYCYFTFSPIRDMYYFRAICTLLSLSCMLLYISPLCQSFSCARYNVLTEKTCVIYIFAFCILEFRTRYVIFTLKTFNFL